MTKKIFKKSIISDECYLTTYPSRVRNPVFERNAKKLWTIDKKMLF